MHRSRQRSSEWKRDIVTTPRIRVAGLLATMAILASSACSTGAGDPPPDPAQIASEPLGASVEPASPFCQAAQFQLAPIAEVTPPASVAEAEEWFESSWTQLSREALTADVGAAASTVVMTFQQIRIKALQMTEVQVSMVTVYRAVAEDCPDLAEPVRQFLITLLQRTDVQVEILTAVWVAVLTLQPLPDLTQPATTDAAAGDEELCQALFEFESETWAWFERTRGSTNEIVDHQQATIDTYLGQLEQAPPGEVKDALSAHVHAVKTRWYHKIYETGAAAHDVCDRHTAARQWPLS